MIEILVSHSVGGVPFDVNEFNLVGCVLQQDWKREVPISIAQSRICITDSGQKDMVITYHTEMYM